MERWYWIELIGFDNEAGDLGVGAFLSRCVSITGVSILFSHIDILFSKGEVLPDTACSYFAHEYNRERRRQSWTRTQLRALVDALHSHGVKVLFSSFDMTRGITDPAWLTYNAHGTPEKLINPIKHISPDRTVGDEVIDRLAAVLEEFGFDGVQLADGLSSARLSIPNGDFSLPICERSGVDIPARLMQDGTDAYLARREWILENKRYEWTRYIADEWARYYEKVFERIDKPIIFNNAWTRDSFEALYRYGLDYRRCQIHRAYGVMIEENSATRGITAPEDEAGVIHTDDSRDGFTYEYALMQQNIRLMTEGLRQISLTPISDTMEQWDAIRHCPTELSRAIVRRYNNFVYRDGRLEVSCDAPLYCLSDGVPGSDWRWLAAQESYRIPTPDFIGGYAAICNTGSLYRELEHYCRSKSYCGSALQRELIRAGSSVSLQLALDEARGFDKASCLLVTDLASYTDAEKEKLTKTALPILAIGEDVELPIPASARYDGRYISVAIYNMDNAPSLDSLAAFDSTKRAEKIFHGEIWTEPLAYKRCDPSFFSELTRIMNEALELDASLTPCVKIASYRHGGEKYIILSNDAHTYTLATVDTREEIASATALMKDTGYRVRISGTRFTVRIPPRGVEIVKLGYRLNKT